MSHSSPDAESVYQTILAVYTRDELRRVVRQSLNENLDTLVADKPFSDQAFELVQWAVRKDRLQELANCLRSKEPAASGEPPYKGLAYFDVADAPLFFGREALTGELAAFLKTRRFLAVVGASGSGKSSLVRAGLVAQLAKGELIAGSERWAVFVLTPTAAPLKALAAALTKDAESVLDTAALMDAMRQDSRSLDLYAARIAARTGAPRVLVVIDQFEELFTLCKDAAQRKAFIDNLLIAAQPDGAAAVVLTLRADFYAHCAEYDNLRAALESSQRYIGAMSPDELRAAVEKPAAEGRWMLEDGLTNRLLRDVADQTGVLPLLSHALLETWKRRSGRMLTFQGYEAAGGVQGAVATTADSTLADLSPDEQAAARSIFIRLTALGEDGAPDTKRRAPLAELSSLPNAEAALHKLETARLITAERDAQGGVQVEVVHEALIREWPKLRAWLDESREGERLHRRLSKWASDWNDYGRRPEDLMPEHRLDGIYQWARNDKPHLTPIEREFVNQSLEKVKVNPSFVGVYSRKFFVQALPYMGALLVFTGAAMWLYSYIFQLFAFLYLLSVLITLFFVEPKVIRRRMDADMPPLAGHTNVHSAIFSGA